MNAIKRDAVSRLERRRDLPDGELLDFITDPDPALSEELAERARAVREQVYGNTVYLRGLIEFTNCCKNDCFYCGIRRSNRNIERYRLTEEQILSCTDRGRALGFRTFVLQGGEDPGFPDERLCALVRTIRTRHPDCAVTLSVGERERKSYEAFYRAGAERYLLRHETACAEHYRKLHPRSMSAEHRYACLRTLKDIGFQVGAGMMVGSPYQTPEDLLTDLRFLQDLEPHMAGIGPFIPHQDTPFRSQPAGGLELTLRLLSILRLMMPKLLLPATTALGTIHPTGREMGLRAGANVVMPNLSPTDVREKYMLYNNKICTGEGADKCIRCLEFRVESAGCHLSMDRGDAPGWTAQRSVIRDRKTRKEEE